MPHRGKIVIDVKRRELSEEGWIGKGYKNRKSNK
jgi:hypothetical protein